MNIELVSARGNVIKPGSKAISSSSIDQQHYASNRGTSTKTSTCRCCCGEVKVPTCKCPNFRLASCWVVFCVAVLCVICSLRFDPTTLFAWHPLLMTIAWIGFATEGLLSYKPVKPFNPRPIHRNLQRKWHGYMQFGCGLFTLLGSVVVVMNKLRLGKRVIPHTVHAWVGAITVMLCIVQVIFGKLKYDRLFLQGVRMAKWHGLVGKLTYGFGILSIVLGCYKKFTAFDFGISMTVIFSVMGCIGYALIYTKRTGSHTYAPVSLA